MAYSVRRKYFPVSGEDFPDAVPMKRQICEGSEKGFMKTVKEVSRITGISVRTLHYYDEIGLLPPTKVSEAGYRLYDEAALEKLRQILFFRELDMPLRDIEKLVNHPLLAKEEILKRQKIALNQKKIHLERVMASIDQILRGEKQMDFEVFEKEDVEELFGRFVENAPKPVLEAAVREFGSMEAFHSNYVEKAFQNYNRPEIRQILLEAYGSKAGVMDSAKTPLREEGVEQLRGQTDQVMRRLVECKRNGLAADSLEAKLLAGEYGLAMKQFGGLKEERQLMTGIADTYSQYPQAREALDGQYEEPGIAEYLAEAIRAFYHA